MSDRYNVIFEGHIKSDASLPDVKAKLAALFKIDSARVEQLFQRAPVVIKHDVTRAEAIQYDRAFEQTGAESRIVPVHQSAAGEATPTPTKTPEPPPQRSVASMPPATEAPCLMTCPKCGFAQAEGRLDCLRCGIVFKRFQKTSEDQNAEQREIEEPAADEDSESEPIEPEEVGVQSIERDGWIALGIGAVITTIVLLLPFLSFIFGYLKVLVHEFGHALMGWLFAYPSIPAFDFTYGGGVALTDERMPVLFILTYGGLAFLFFVFRRNTLTLVLLGILTAFYSLCAFTDLHQIVILFMGHGAELCFAGLFLYRALSGSGIIVALERPLYAFVGLFIEFLDLQFAVQLLTNYGYRVDYEEAKGGGHWMDFSRIAEEFFNVDLAVVAGFFLFCCVLPPLCAFLFFRYQPAIFRALARVLQTEPKE